jgi:ABC-type transport system involved in multi-copper enzyme maturation permease subunit
MNETPHPPHSSGVRRTLYGTTAVAFTTLLDAVRSRLLLVGLFFGVVLVGLSVSAASVSIGDRSRLILDVGLAAMSGLGSIMALALTIATFTGELARRTAYPVLVRPLPRFAFVLGKYLGVVAAMECVVTLMALATGVVTVVYGGGIPEAFYACVWLSYVEIALVAAIAAVFASMTVGTLAASYTAALLLAGNLTGDLRMLAERAAQRGDAAAEVVLNACYWLLPDLAELSARSQAANALPVPDGLVLHGTVYGLTYAFAALVVAMWIFNRRKAF